jgi:carbonic anhydrase/acetyltransferase-like protein (isoleucine patch superfamily)
VRLLLVGAGGHARGVVDAAVSDGHEIVAYEDPKESAWCAWRRVRESDDWPSDIDGCVLGIGGVTAEALCHRLDVFSRYVSRGAMFPAIRHSGAIMGSGATASPASVVLAGAIVQAGATIGPAAIVNTGAIVEHGAAVGEGVHIAPGAIVLGDAVVGRASMIGAGAVVLAGATVPEGVLVKAQDRFDGRGRE